MSAGFALNAHRSLRDALRDSADNPIFIETIERRGYRWIAPIQRMEAVPAESRKEEPREKDSPQKQVAAAEPPSKPSPWRKVVFVFPLLAMLFGVWIFRPGHRDAKASAKSSPVSAQGLHQSANREAEDFYLKGRFYWNKRTPESLNQALEAFTQAIAHDPNYSDAYVGLADCYNLLREFSAMPGNEAYFKAFAAAKKASSAFTGIRHSSNCSPKLGCRPSTEQQKKDWWLRRSGSITGEMSRLTH